MAKKIVYEYSKDYGYWPIAKGLADGKDDLAMLFESLNLQHDWIVTEKGIHEVIIWDSWDKENYPTEDHIPKLIMTRKSYDDIMAVCDLNKKNPKKYLVFTQHESGLITMEAKNDVSEQDLQAIAKDQAAGQAWQEAWKKQHEDYWIKKKWRILQYKISRLWLRLRQWLQM